MLDRIFIQERELKTIDGRAVDTVWVVSVDGKISKPYFYRRQAEDFATAEAERLGYAVGE